MDGERIRAGWAGVAAAAEQELIAWREAYPTATLAEIEVAVQAALSRLQARYLSDLVHASAAANLRETATEARPPCPSCGGNLRPLGGLEGRTILTPGQPEPLRLERSYGECTACGSRLSPPGRGTGVAAGRAEPDGGGGVGAAGGLDAVRAGRRVPGAVPEGAGQ